MNERTDKYINASVLMGGLSCMILLVGRVCFRISSFNEPLIPGILALSGICYPILFASAGNLLRSRFRKLEKLPGILASLATLSFVFIYMMLPDYQMERIYFLYGFSFGAGFLFPDPEKAGGRTGWEALFLLMAALFCFTVAGVIQERLGGWAAAYCTDVFMPEHQDMKELIKTLLHIANPLMLLMTLYFLLSFSFSGMAQRLAVRHWFRGALCVPVILGFVGDILIYFRPFLRLEVLIRLLVQPLTVCLLIWVMGKIHDYRTKKTRR